MMIILILIIVIIILFVSNSVNAYTMEGYNAVNTNSKKKPKLVLYYTNWCGYSKAFLPIWQKIKNTQDITLEYEEYECDKNKAICDAQNIAGFPSLVLFKQDGSKISYPDTLPRTQELILDFIKKNT